MEGNASEAQTAAFLIALRTKGETVQEIAGLARTMRELSAKVERGRGRARGHRRHRRRAAHVQRLHHRRVHRGRRRLPGGQARQPLGHEPVRLGRRARGARRAHRPGARGRGRVHPRARLRVHVRSAPPRRHEARGAGAQGARGAHDLQLPRAADQSRGRDPPGDRRVRSRVSRHDGRGPRRARRAARRW